MVVHSEIFADLQGGYGVKAWRNGEISQVVMPSRTTIIARRVNGSAVDGATVDNLRKISLDEATKFKDYIDNLQPSNLSVMRFETA